MIKIVCGNILNADEDIIGHQVNCKGVMGAGLTKQIRNTYPHVYDDYKTLCENTKNKSSLLGHVQCVKINKDEIFGKIIANIFAQEKYGRNSVHTNYTALREGLEKLRALVTSKHFYNKSIALPYYIGCGLAGGDWNEVYGIIEDVFSDYEVTLYKL